MAEVKPVKPISDFQLYRELVAESRKLGLVRIRRATFLGQLYRHLRSFGGATLWIFLMLAAGLFVAVIGPRSAFVTEIAILIAGVFISYVAILTGIFGSYADILVLARGLSVEETVYRWAAQMVVNRRTIATVLPGLFVLVVLLRLVYRSAVFVSVGALGLIAVISFTLLQGNWALKNVRDYIRLASAIVGRTTVVTRTTQELVEAICNLISDYEVDDSGKELLVQLADSDLRRAENRLDWANLSLGIGAVVIGLLFTDQLAPILVASYNAVGGFFDRFSASAGSILLLPPTLNRLFLDTLNFALWLFAANIVIGAGFVIFRAILSIYFVYYRPAHALHQALILVQPGDIKETSAA